MGSSTSTSTTPQAKLFQAIKDHDSSLVSEICRQHNHVKTSFFASRLSLVDSNDSKKRETPLILCAHQEDVDIARILLKYRASVDKQDSCGQTALHHASAADALSFVRLLVTYHFMYPMYYERWEHSADMHTKYIAFIDATMTHDLGGS